VAKLSNISGVRRGPKLVTPMDADMEENDSDDDSSSDEEDNGTEAPASTSSKTPILQVCYYLPCCKMSTRNHPDCLAFLQSCCSDIKLGNLCSLERLLIKVV
jgi:hypothetical protein